MAHKQSAASFGGGSRAVGRRGSRLELGLQLGGARRRGSRLRLGLPLGAGAALGQPGGIGGSFDSGEGESGIDDDGFGRSRGLRKALFVMIVDAHYQAYEGHYHSYGYQGQQGA